MLKHSIFFIVVIGLFGCNRTSGDLDKSLTQSGENEKELRKVLVHYKNDKLKYKAAEFLISNMHLHYHIDGKLIDGNGKKIELNVFDYKNGELFSKAKDSILAISGVQFQRSVLLDVKNISSEELILNIDLAFDVWKSKHWASHVTFDQFCEYILPYRAYREPVENWRAMLRYKYDWLNDSTRKVGDDPVKVCSMVNDELKTWLKFDWGRGTKTLHDQSISEIVSNKHGKCIDLVTMASCAMRSQGIPVAIDEVSHWGHRAYGHTWNVVLDKNGNCIPFGGAEKNPGEHDAILSYVKVGKIFRNRFAKQPDNLLEQVEDINQIPPLFYRMNLEDVTEEYVDVGDILLDNLRVKTNDEIAYLCLYNGGEWRPIHWSFIDGQKAEFKNMGKNNVLYLPATFKYGKVYPIDAPFVFTKSNEKIHIRPSGECYDKITITHNNKVVNELRRDGSFTEYPIKKNYRYKLAYWEDQWKYLENQTADTSFLVCENVLKGTLYKLEYLDYGNTGQRPFILKNGVQEFL